MGRQDYELLHVVGTDQVLTNRAGGWVGLDWVKRPRGTNDSTGAHIKKLAEVQSISLRANPGGVEGQVDFFSLVLGKPSRRKGGHPGNGRVPAGSRQNQHSFIDGSRWVTEDRRESSMTSSGIVCGE